jgi:phosphate transport system substrate-binding protein
MIKMSKFLILFFALVLTGCNWINQDPYTNTPTTGRIKVCIDETFRPIAEAELQVFNALYQYSEITPIFLPEDSAFDLLLKDCTNLIIASRPLAGNEKELFEQKNLFPRELKIAIDAIAIVVNPMNDESLLSLIDLKSILSGKIKNWNQLNPKSKSGEISVIFDNEKSSTVRYMVDSVLRGAPLAKNLFALDINSDVINYVSQHPGAMGLIGVSWISDSDDTLQLSFLNKVKVLAISKENVATWQNSFQPYQAYMFDHSYPLTRDIWAIDTEPRNGLATGFMSFITSDKGQRIILKTGILPANAPVRLVKVRSDL